MESFRLVFGAFLNKNSRWNIKIQVSDWTVFDIGDTAKNLDFHINVFNPHLSNNNFDLYSVGVILYIINWDVYIKLSSRHCLIS